VRDNILAGGNATQDATGVVRQKPLRCHFVAVLGAFLRDGLETGADLHALHCIDAHQRKSEVGIQPVIHRLAPAYRRAFSHHTDFAPMESPALRRLSM